MKKTLLILSIVIINNALLGQTTYLIKDSMLVNKDTLSFSVSQENNNIKYAYTCNQDRYIFYHMSDTLIIYSSISKKPYMKMIFNDKITWSYFSCLDSLADSVNFLTLSKSGSKIFLSNTNNVLDANGSSYDLLVKPQKYGISTFVIFPKNKPNFISIKDVSPIDKKHFFFILKILKKSSRAFNINIDVINNSETFKRYTLLYKRKLLSKKYKYTLNVKEVKM